MKHCRVRSFMLWRSSFSHVCQESAARSTRGFTLVEMLVALAVFSLVGGVVLNMLAFSIASQRDALANQIRADQISFMAEYMGRAIRQAQKDTLGECVGGSGHTTLLVEGAGTVLRFVDRDARCREFSLETGGGKAIRERISPDSSASGLGAYSRLTSNNINVQDLSFFVDGEFDFDGRQPRATFFVNADGLRLQTTISQRRFDGEE